MSNGIMISGEGFYDGIGVNTYEAYGAAVTVQIPMQPLVGAGRHVRHPDRRGGSLKDWN